MDFVPEPLKTFLLKNFTESAVARGVVTSGDFLKSVHDYFQQYILEC